MHPSIICLAFVGVLAGQSLGMAWKDCASTPGSLKKVNVVGCESVPVCPITKGTNATITFDFVPAADAKNATSVVHGIIAKVPIPFKIPNPDACNTAGSGLTCPLKAGTAYTYQSVIPVLKEYPSINVEVKWELQDTSGNDIFCAEMPISIK